MEVFFIYTDYNIKAILAVIARCTKKKCKAIRYVRQIIIARSISIRFYDPECNGRETPQGSPGSSRLTPLCHILFRPLMNHINIPRCRTVPMQQSGRDKWWDLILQLISILLILSWRTPRSENLIAAISDTPGCIRGCKSSAKRWPSRWGEMWSSVGSRPVTVRAAKTGYSVHAHVTRRLFKARLESNPNIELLIIYIATCSRQAYAMTQSFCFKRIIRT